VFSFNKKSVKALALCVTLELGALCGVPIRPEELERALKLNQNAVVLVTREREPDTKLPE
jgi:hypothetical protein